MCCARSEVLRCVALLAVAACLASCSLTMQVPEPFLVLRTPGDEVKATTPEDARLWVREFADPDEGDAAFWTEALAHDLERRGYQPLGEAEQVRDAAGRTGFVRSFAVDADGREHGYLVAVFVRDHWWSGHIVRVAEFVAPRAAFDTLAPRVRAALATLQP